MRSFLSDLRKLDWILIITALLLVGIGLLSICSSSIGKKDFLNLNKQIIFFCIGLFLMFLFSFFDYRILRNDPYLILILYFFCLIFLLGLYFFAPEIRGVRAWYKLGPVSLDPIEPTKIILLILLAKYFSMRHVEMYRIRHIFLSGFYVLLPSILIFFQPDFGSVLILFFLWLTILIISGIKIRHFLILCLCGLLLFVFSWNALLKTYQKERILGFIAPQIEPLKTSWSQIQSEIAIGSGGFFGRGFGSGPQTQYGFLPEPQTDFIFAAIAEEFGLFGVLIILSLFIVLILRIIKIALHGQTNFCRLYASGFAALLTAQIFINIGMNLRFLPVIGISLPFISYGGSGLLTLFLGLGILQNIRKSL